MNGGKPCEGNDTETARSCFAPCPGVSLNISSPSGTMRMSFIYSFIYSFFFYKKTAVKYILSKYRKTRSNRNIASFPVLRLLLYRF